jgi:hypothetical protein
MTRFRKVLGYKRSYRRRGYYNAAFAAAWSRGRIIGHGRFIRSHKSSDSIMGKKVDVCGLRSEVQTDSYIISVRLKALGQVYHDLRKILRLKDLRRMTTLNIFDDPLNACSVKHHLLDRKWDCSIVDGPDECHAPLIILAIPRGPRNRPRHTFRTQQPTPTPAFPESVCRDAHSRTQHHRISSHYHAHAEYHLPSRLKRRDDQ